MHFYLTWALESAHGRGRLEVELSSPISAALLCFGVALVLVLPALGEDAQPHSEDCDRSALVIRGGGGLLNCGLRSRCRHGPRCCSMPLVTFGAASRAGWRARLLGDTTFVTKLAIEMVTGCAAQVNLAYPAVVPV